MPVPEPLIEAYAAAHYVVFGEPEIVLLCGERNAHLDALLEAHRATCAAFVSAANPHGERRGVVANVIAFYSLKYRLKKSHYLFFEGEGRDPAGEWPPEGSVLVLDIERPAAEALGKRYEQNAIVYIKRGGAPELVLLR